jgi:hypothetical protein
MQEEKKPAAMDEKAAMDMMMKLASPSEGHKKLDPMAGSWVAAQQMWMQPGAPPTQTEGMSEHKWVLGGRFMEQRMEGTFMNMSFSGLGYTGYDNYKKQYVTVWIDNFGTSMMTTSGSFDPDGKALTTSGEIDDPTTGKKATVREKTTFVNNDEFLFEMFTPGQDGKEFRMLEIRYTRKK